MNPKEAGFLLLTGKLGNPDRKTLTTAQLKTLGQRVRGMEKPPMDRELEQKDLTALGYGPEMAGRILALLEETDILAHYLRRGEKLGCVPLTWVSHGYPARLKEKLRLEAPGCLWAKGDLSILENPCVSLVGSRDLAGENRRFAEEVGRQAAIQGYTLVSGNARGADKTAQNACLEAGGRVISIVADDLCRQPLRKRVLFLSEDGFDEEFSAQRALSRNRCIHALGEKTFVAQSALGSGGTWDGTVKNLRNQWSPVFVFADGSAAARELEMLGAQTLKMPELFNFSGLTQEQRSIFDR